MGVGLLCGCPHLLEHSPSRDKMGPHSLGLLEISENLALLTPLGAIEVYRAMGLVSTLKAFACLLILNFKCFILF